jgi:hypothetical protein
VYQQQRPVILRSAIPRVVGILALVFAPLGMLFSLGWVAGPLDDLSRLDDVGAWSGFRAWLILWGLLSFGVFAVHLTAGILATMYKRGAPRWMTIYGISAIGLCIGDAILVGALAPSGGPHHSALVDSVYAHWVFSVLAVPWPVLALVLMNLRGAKDACQPPRAVELTKVFG